MLLEISLALLLGITAGTLTGLTPGLHINLLAAILLAITLKLQSLPLIALAVFITSMSITHTFLDFIPSIFLGAPDEDSFLAILPGHELLKEGQGYQAVILTLYGSLTALPIILLFTPIFMLFLPSFFQATKFLIPFILIFASLYLTLREKEPLLAITIFLLAGFLGFTTLNLPIQQPLLPLLTGLFGLSTLAVSLQSKSKMQKQKILPLKKIKLTKKEFLKSTSIAAIAAPLCSFLPGIGSGHAAVIGSEIQQQTRKSFLFLVGAINTIIMALSFVTIYTINKARSGTAAAIKEILQTITPEQILIIITTIIITGLLAFPLAINITKLTAKQINKINYKKLTFITISLLIILNLIFTNPLGLLVLITATSLGIFTILSSSRRINLMSALIIPAVIFYLTN